LTAHGIGFLVSSSVGALHAGRLLTESTLILDKVDNVIEALVDAQVSHHEWPLDLLVINKIDSAPRRLR